MHLWNLADGPDRIDARYGATINGWAVRIVEYGGRRDIQTRKAGAAPQ